MNKPRGLGPSRAGIEYSEAESQIYHHQTLPALKLTQNRFGTKRIV